MKNISFILNGKKVIAKEGETIWQVAKKHGVKVKDIMSYFDKEMLTI